MATPIIAQVHGYCLAGGTELATACDLVYVAEDATDRLPAGAADVATRHAVADLDDGAASRHGGAADRRLDVRRRGRRVRVRQPRPPARRARRRGARHGRTDHQGAVRPARPQQAVGPPRDGGDGHPDRHPCDRRDPGARASTRSRRAEYMRSFGERGRDGSAERARPRVRRLPGGGRLPGAGAAETGASLSRSRRRSRPDRCRSHRGGCRPRPGTRPTGRRRAPSPCRGTR